MFENEEKRLHDMSERNRDISTPEKIDDYIRTGIKDGRKKKRKARIKFAANMAALFMLVSLITSIRVSPAFAALVGKIPGLEYIVDMINYDKGLKAAVDNSFVERVNISQEQEGINFTIKDMIIDNSRAIIFYSIENKSKYDFINMGDIYVTDKEGRKLSAGISYGFINSDEERNRIINDKLEFDFTEDTVITDELNVEISLRGSDTEEAMRYESNRLSSVWKFKIPVDMKKLQAMQKVYDINQNVVIDNQNILFKKVTITPTRIGVDMEFDKNNSKRIFGFDDIEIVDGKGEKWATIMNGMSGTMKDEDHRTLYFQSSYFSYPEELYIRSTSIRALDKDKTNVVVDLNECKLLKTPDDKLTLSYIRKSDKSIDVCVAFKKEGEIDDKVSFNIFGWEFKDGSGKTFKYNESGIAYEENNIQHSEARLPGNIKYENPIILQIIDYPSRIKGDINIKIK